MGEGKAQSNEEIPRKKTKLSNYLDIPKITKSGIQCSVSIISLFPAGCCASCGKIVCPDDLFLVTTTDIVLPHVTIPPKSSHGY